ncbi:hypothetical protein EBZ80_18860, partial [bacterium]|nr:hypothetical protein [bacterium]
VRATDQASSAMSSFGASASKTSGIAAALKSDFGTMAAAFGTASIAVSGVIGAFEGAARALQAMNAEVIDAERVSAKLTAAFFGAEGAAARLTKQAEELSASTVFFDDDAIKSAAAAMKAFDLTEKQIGQLLPVAINLATVYGTDLESAGTRLALGLKGSTRALREFDLTVKEGANQAEIMAAILKRGEGAAKGAAEAQTGLRGATEGLKKAQGEFNQALGTLLSGPQTAFLNFLSAATNGATQLANSMSGVAAQTSYAWKTFNLKTGKVEGGEAITGGAPGSPGTIPGVPLSAFGRALIGRRQEQPSAPVSAPSAPSRASSPRRGTRAAELMGIDWEAVQRFNQDWVEKQTRQEKRAAEDLAKTQRQNLEDLIQANENFYQDRLRQEQDIGDAQLKHVEELKKKSEEMAANIRSAGDTLVGILTGKTSPMDLVKQISSSIGLAVGGPAGSAIVDMAFSVGQAIASAITTKNAEGQNAFMANLADFISYQTEDDKRRRQLEIEAAKLQKEAAQQQIEAAIITSQRSKMQTEQSLGQREAALRGPLALAAFNLQREVPLTSLTNQYGQIDQAQVTAIESASQMIRGLSEDQAKSLSSLGERLVKGTATDADQKAFLDRFGVVAGSTAGRAISLTLADLAPGAGAQPTAAEAQQLGDSARNPVYVFDVSPSKDEFTRAPRGLFFRPVGIGRGVDAGQALAR